MTSTTTSTETVTTSTGKTLRVRVAPVGTNHGSVGQLVARNGRVVWEGDVFASGSQRCAEQAREAAAKL